MGTEHTHALPMHFASLVCILAVIAPVYVSATIGVDVSQLTSSSAFSCLKQQGFDFAVARGYQSVGRVDPNAAASIKNARAAGIQYVDAYIFPCFKCGNPAGQVRDTVNTLKNQGADFGMLWLDIEGSQYWGSQSANQQFFEGLVSASQEMNVKLGVYTSESQWEPIMGSYSGGSSYPLWYAHYDGSQSFSDFRPFGGWSKPNIKQFRGTTTVCGAGVDENWY